MMGAGPKQQLLLHSMLKKHQWLMQTLTWDTQTPVAVANAAADPMGTGVQGTEVHELGTRRAGEACCAAAAKAQGARPLCIACSIIVTGAGGTGVHLLLTCSTLESCRSGKAETRVRICKTERRAMMKKQHRVISEPRQSNMRKVSCSLNQIWR